MLHHSIILFLSNRFGGLVPEHLDLTEMTFIQCLLKSAMDEMERDPEMYRDFKVAFTLETARSIEMKIANYIDNLGAEDDNRRSW